MTKKHTYISLFSSAGVGCYGFKLNDYECIATNEIIERRINIQKINNKCRFNSGYIIGDIKLEETKNLIYDEINKWNELGYERVSVVIATPPCQGMSVANHKKKANEIDRNSLVVESVNMIKRINPYFFILENVAAFWKTGCINEQGKIVTIGELIIEQLGSDFEIEYRIINFKNYGSNSSRTRTLVIGVDKNLSLSPSQFFPDACEEVTLKQVIGDMKPLNWGEYDENDFYHGFRVYPEHMRDWIKDLTEGQSAFDNIDKCKQPHKMVNGEIVVNQSKNGDKYTRQVYDKVAPCIHTRNDQLASQNTIHPKDDRVFSIRELMKLMTIPDEFRWLDIPLESLNSLSLSEKQKISKKNEMNIRQSIGEAVPTAIFNVIAKKIKHELYDERQ